MKYSFNIKSIIKIILIILIIMFVSIMTPFVIKRYNISKIKDAVIKDLKINNAHSDIIRTYTGETDAQNFYFYIEYKESNIIYVVEYLCQKIDNEWVFYFVAKDFLRNEE